MHTLQDWLQVHCSAATFNKMPQSGKPHFMVFDRTYTLYTPNPKNLDKAYTLSENNKAMVKRLTKKHVKCLILSGHGTGDAKAHLKSCKDDFNGTIDPSHIIFDTKYHGKDSAKKAVIRNLQLYGSIDTPTAFLMRIYAQFRSIFWTYKVGMVGDGNNDVEALEQADFSVGVYTNTVSYTHLTLPTKRIV